MSASAADGRRAERAAREARSRSRTEKILRAFHEEELSGKSYDAALLRRLLPYVKPYMGLVMLAALAIGIIQISALARPQLMRWAIDEGAMAKDGDKLLQGGLLIAGLVLVEQLLNFTQIYVLQVVGARSMAGLRRTIFQHLHKLRVAYFDTQPVGRLVTRVTNDVDHILELFASGAVGAFGDLIRLVGIVYFMLSIDWQLALFAFAALPPVLLLVKFVRSRSRRAYREIRAKTARMNATMNEHVSGMAVTQAFNQEDSAATEFDDINADYRDANIRAVKYEATQDAAIEMVSAICLASIIVYLGYEGASFGTVVAFSVYLGMFFEPITALAQRYTLLQSAMAGAERVFGLLDNELVDAPKKAVAADGDPNLAFELEGVDFAYKPDVPVLRQVSMAAKRCEKIALVGPTGAGKTTVASLILRLYEVQAGVVRVEGKDVAGYEREELRRKFSVVPQDVFLFQGSVLDNIAAGEEPDLERARGALRQLGVLELFERREGGLDAPVIERGANFSAGERQLIAFARALYRDAELLILDEATASVDSDTEAMLQKALEELLRGRTALIIAHRLSTIRAVDRIVVFHKGRVVEQGSHDELIEQGGLYARLHALHFARRGEDGGEAAE